MAENYVLSEQRIPYMRDKTADDRFFLLMLFAIAFELEAASLYAAEEILDVQLAIGLPPLHFGSQYKRFQEYFLGRDILDFSFGGRPYSIYIDKAALASPQIREQKKLMIFDLGGFTVDYVQIRDRRPDFAVKFPVFFEDREFQSVEKGC